MSFRRDIGNPMVEHAPRKTCRLFLCNFGNVEGGRTGMEFTKLLIDVVRDVCVRTSEGLHSNFESHVIIVSR